MTILRLFLFSLLLIASAASAESGKWLGPDRSTWPNTEYRQTKSDFGGWLLITSDLDWQQKWNTPPDAVPYFNEAKSVKVGEQLVILTFFVNPKTDQGNRASVRCDIKVTRPDKSTSVYQQGIPCLSGELIGNPNHIRLSPAVIHFLGEKKDPLGNWVVEVVITDVKRNISLNLKTSFLLER
jgi:hypothetical protein